MSTCARLRPLCPFVLSIFMISLLSAARVFAQPETADSTSMDVGKSLNLPTFMFDMSKSEKQPSQDEAGIQRSCKIAAGSLLVSGLLLCSWGITSWQVEEYQCCPARNTDNVIKIVAGVLLINAGLLYLIEGCD